MNNITELQGEGERAGGPLPFDVARYQLQPLVEPQPSQT
jgi:hypothetical protein